MYCNIIQIIAVIYSSPIQTLLHL